MLLRALNFRIKSKFAVSLDGFTTEHLTGLLHRFTLHKPSDVLFKLTREYHFGNEIYLLNLNGINIRFNNLKRERNGKGNEESE